MLMKDKYKLVNKIQNVSVDGGGGSDTELSVIGKVYFACSLGIIAFYCSMFGRWRLLKQGAQKSTEIYEKNYTFLFCACFFYELFLS